MGLLKTKVEPITQIRLVALGVNGEWALTVQRGKDMHTTKWISAEKALQQVELALRLEHT